MPNYHLNSIKLAGTDVTFKPVGQFIKEYEGEVFNITNNNYNVILPKGYNGHAEGVNTSAGFRSHAEGYMTVAGGGMNDGGSTAHAEGRCTVASGKCSHAEGTETYIELDVLDVEGDDVICQTLTHIPIEGNLDGQWATLIELNDDIIDPHKDDEGEFDWEPPTPENDAYSWFKQFNVGDLICLKNPKQTTDVKRIIDIIPKRYILNEQVDVEPTKLIIEGIFKAVNFTEEDCDNGFIPAGTKIVKVNSTTASALAAHAEGAGTKAQGKYSHTEGYITLTSADCAHAEGCRSEAVGIYTHAEGYKTSAIGERSHAEGSETQAIGKNSHAEGSGTKSNNECSHAEGYNTVANGKHSHAENNQTIASGDYSHAEGYKAEASGSTAHAEGSQNIASGDYSHAEGLYTFTQGKASHVQGRYNQPDNNEIDAKGYRKYAHIVGNGTSTTDRSNAHTLDWDGNAWYQGSVECNSIILKSPNGTRFEITINDNGELNAVELEQ